MSRTGLFSSLRRLLATAHVAQRTGQTPAEVLAVMAARKRQRGPSRRQFLGGTLGAAAILPFASACGDDLKGSDVRVAVIGGGVAGLHCAYRLAEAELDVVVFEASVRTGGRMQTGRGLFPDGQICELGGELVDTGHVVMQGLCDELGLTLDDLPMETVGLQPDTFHFDGAEVDVADLATEFTPLAATMASSLMAAEADDDEFARVDGMSIPEWLNDEAGLPTTSMIRRVLELAYIAEYGLEVDQQTILNLLYLIDFETPDPFHIFGDSDEVFHIHEGNDAVPTALAEGLTDDRIRTEHTLSKVTLRDDLLFDLDFTTPEGTVTIVAEHVVFALPFTKLRAVNLSEAGLGSEKRMIISNLGYGTNAKLMMGFDSRPWATGGASGSSFSDQGELQTTWDSARGQDGAGGIMTNFVGGDRGVSIGDGDAEERAVEVLPWLNTVFPGSTAAYASGSAVRMHWPTNPYVLGSYACYTVGQYSFWGLEGTRVGNMHFCGEHTSLESQGYMEGGAETGGLVAMEILDDYGIAASARLQRLMAPRLALPQATYHAGRWRGETRRWRRQQRRRLAR